MLSASLITILTAIVLQASAVETNASNIIILEPKEGSNVSADNLTIMVEVKNFNLTGKFGQTNVTGEGHIHYYLDAVVPTEPSKPAISAPGTYAPSANKTYIWQNVTEGTHNLSVQLVNNDHPPLNPPVVRTVDITSTSAQQNVVVDLIAMGIAFNKKSITVPAGSNVTVNFDNQDTAIPHNFAVYDSALAKKTIFRGEIVSGPKKIVYRFDAPQEPGTYFFRCDPHAPIMNGQFIVQ
ncbi:MAG: cupredoxin domain-containing protein [Methanotrichaceae archaeon]|nr:cupredoxin domain-containing protein [Methanotrichaceae archaeon]